MPSTSKKINNLLFVLIFLFSLSSCVNWDKESVRNSIRTDIIVHLTVNDLINTNPIPNQLVSWSIHLYNGSSNTDSDLRTGQVITNTNGEADIPVYKCQLVARIIARVIASTPEQAVNAIEAVTVTYQVG